MKKRKVKGDWDFDFEIVIDTREQKPFRFKDVPKDKIEGGGHWKQIPYRVSTLGTGDYSILGFEPDTRIGDRLVGVGIERKSKEDLYQTLTQGRERFENELVRLVNQCRYALIVVESDLNDIVKIPPIFSDVKPKTIIRTVISYQVKYPSIQWAFCTNRAFAEVYAFRYLMRCKKQIDEIVEASGAQVIESGKSSESTFDNKPSDDQLGAVDEIEKESNDSLKCDKAKTESTDEPLLGNEKTEETEELVI